MACSEWKVPFLPVKPWQMTLVSLVMRMDIGSKPYFPPRTAFTIFWAASSRSSAGITLRPDSRMICLPSSTLVPSRRTTSGTCRPTVFTAAITPRAMTSHFMMPPKMLTRMPFTFGSAVMILNAAVTEEVRRLFAVELDDVERRHGKARAVDHAADGAVERNVGEVVLGGLDFLLVLLRDVTQCDHVGVTVEGVAVEGDLGVEALEVLILGDDQRVDLQHLHVLRDE